MYLLAHASTAYGLIHYKLSRKLTPDMKCFLKAFRRISLMVLQDFIYKPILDKAVNEKKVDKFDLNSLYYEPGQKSYMREAIAYQVLQ